MPWREIVRIALPLSIALTVFAFGLVTRREDGWFLRRHPALALRSFLSLDVVMPLLAIGMAAAFDLDPSLEVALVALSVSPVSPLVARKEVAAGGRDSYAVALLFGSALLAALFIPGTVHAVASWFQRDLNVPGIAVLEAVSITVLGPLAAAVVARALVPRDFLAAMAPTLRRIAVVLMVVGVLPLLVPAFRDVPAMVGDGTLVAIAVLAAGGLIAGHLLGGPERSDRTVLAFSTASRHPAVAITIGAEAAPGQRRVLTAVLLYLVVSSLAGTLYVQWAEWKRSRAQPTPPQNASE